MTDHTTGEEHWPGQGQLNQAAKMHYQRGKREAWEKMHQKCEYHSMTLATCWYHRRELGGRETVCTYSTCPLLKEKP